MDGRTTSGTKKTVTPPNRVLSTQVAGALRRAAIQGRAVASMTPMTLWQKESSPAATARPRRAAPPPHQYAKRVTNTRQTLPTDAESVRDVGKR